MMRAKSKLVAPRAGSRISEETRSLRAREKAKEKLGLEEFNRVQDLFRKLNVSGNKHKKLLDGLIMGLLQKNVSNYQIRAVTGCGISRINRIRRVIEDPTLLNKPRAKPAHAVTPEDIENLKKHLQT